MSHLTAPFFARYPGVTVAVLSLTSQEIQRGIEDFELDAGVTYLDNEPLDGVRARPLYAEEYVFLTPVGGRFAERETLTWREAARGAFVPADPRHAEPAHPRRHLPLRRRDAEAGGRDQFDLQPRQPRRLGPLVVDRAAAAAAILRHPREDAAPLR